MVQVEIEMHQQFPDGTHNLGKFRVSLTDSPKPLNATKLPANVAAALKVDSAKRTDAQKATIRNYYFSLDRNHGQLAAAVAQVQFEKANPRLVGFQDVAWALINNPSFLFNR